MNFYQMLSEGEARILTFERGVEDYTLACGTGCGSTACVLWKQGKLPGGVLTAHNRGGTLKVTVSAQDGVVSSLMLEGPTQVERILELDEV